MGGESERRNRKKNSRKRRSKGNDADTSSDFSISESEEETKRSSRKRSQRKPHKSRKLDYRSEEDSEEDSEYERRRERKRRNKRKREKHERKGSKLDRKKKYAESDSSEDSRSSSNTDVDGQDRNVDTAQKLVQHILRKFPSVKLELKQLLKMLDDGQAVDIQGISSKSLLRFLKKLFQSLNLKKTGKGIYVLPKGASPCLEAVGSIIECDSRIAPEIKCKLQEHCLQDKENKNCDLQEGEDKDTDGNEASHVEVPGPKVHSPLSNKRRMIGPTMPSAEMLAAAAKLTEAEAALREAEEELEKGVLIGPPPPSAVAEAESANDAERFEEVTRIIALDASNPYEILGLNRTMPAESLKKRYWKLSLLVHPDKCSHPEAHQAFTRLNQAFKDLQDPTKRAAIDNKIIQREEKEEFEAELKASREAAQWRRLRGEARSGDDELLGSGDSAPKRDEWMTALPAERKPAVSMHSTFFSKSEKAERGDTSIWTDNPVEKAEKAKMHYLEAYKQAALTAGDDGIDCLEKKRSSAAAELMDNYNKSKRSLSLVEKHQQEKKKGSKKAKQSEKQHEEEWSGKHPWKPWDRETDLSAGRQAVNLDAKTSVEGLSSRFSSGNIERSFL